MAVYSFIGEALIGWLIADLLSGLLHWIGDSDELSRFRLVNYISGFNVDHHADPLAITRQSFLARNITQFAIVTTVSVVWALCLGPSVVWAFATLGGLLVGEVHCWSHSPSKTNKLVRVLQETGLIQSPKHHAVHHRPPHQTRFCVLTDWLNPVLDAIGIWQILDRPFSRKSST